MADEVDSKSIGGNTVRVQVPRPARSINREFSGNIRRFAVFLITVKSSPTRTGMWYNGGVTFGDEYNRNTNQEGKSMKKKTIRLTGFALAMMLSLSPIVPAGSNPFVFTAEAHSGRTDSSGATGITRIRADWAAIIIIAEVIRPIYIRMESVRIRMGLPAVPEAQALPTVMHPAPEVLRLPLRYRKQRLQRPWKL